MEGSWVLDEVRQRIMEQREDGVRCPCCDQFVKVYQRTITAPVAATLVVLHRNYGFESVHVPTLLTQTLGAAGAGGDFTKLRYWNLIERADGERKEGAKTSGHWRLTHLGADFVMGDTLIPKYVRVFDGVALPRDPSKPVEMMSIRDALTEKFDYAKLMGVR